MRIPMCIYIYIYTYIYIYIYTQNEILSTATPLRTGSAPTPSAGTHPGVEEPKRNPKGVQKPCSCTPHTSLFHIQHRIAHLQCRIAHLGIELTTEAGFWIAQLSGDLGMGAMGRSAPSWDEKTVQRFATAAYNLQSLKARVKLKKRRPRANYKKLPARFLVPPSSAQSALIGSSRGERRCRRESIYIYIYILFFNYL